MAYVSLNRGRQKKIASELKFALQDTYYNENKNRLLHQLVWIIHRGSTEKRASPVAGNGPVP
jgi:hypothetical protein